MSEHMITIKRQSESWVGDVSPLEDRLWATAVATRAACFDLSRQLTDLLCRSPHSHRIKDGHIGASLETLHIYQRVVVELTLTIEEAEEECTIHSVDKSVGRRL